MHKLSIAGFVSAFTFALFALSGSAYANKAFDCSEAANASLAFCQCVAKGMTDAHLDKYVQETEETHTKISLIVNGCFDEFSGINTSIPTTLSLDEPSATDDGGWTFGWQASNYPVKATIMFYASTDTSHFAGTPISDALPATPVGNYVWNGSGVPPGKYYVYAELDGMGMMPRQLYASEDQYAVNTTTDLSLSLAGPPKVVSGKSFELDIKVVNAGPKDAPGVEAIIQLPSGLYFAKGQEGIKKDELGQHASLPLIASGTHADLSLVVHSSTVQTPGTKTIAVSLASPVFNTNSSGNQATFDIAVMTSK